MRKYYELKIWVNDYSRKIFEDLLLVIRKRLLLNSCRTFLRHGWQEGYHYSFIIDVSNSTDTDVSEIEKMIINYLLQYPSDNYDHDQFRERYKIISRLEDQFPDAFDIKENNSFQFRDITKSLQYSFENEDQVDIYFQLHVHFDHWFQDFYGKANDNLFFFIGILLLLGSNIPDRTLHEAARLYSNGFISHLSHFIGFLHSLNTDSQDKVEAAFNNHYLQDRDQFKEYLITSLLSDQLAETKHFVCDSLTLFEHLKGLFNKGMLTYFSPRKRDLKDIAMHPSHMAVFQNPVMMDLVEKDSTLVCYKWVLSTFYEKLPLLNISPKQKFYMNFFIYQFYQNEFSDLKSLLREKAMIYEEEITS